MKYQSLSCLIVLLLGLSNSNLAQTVKDNSVAKIGNITISNEEFIERFEFTPIPRKENKSITNSIKLEFLYTLIAEKLWALESELRGFDTTEAIKFSEKAFEKMFVRDALFTREIKDKVSVSENELIEGLIKNSTKLKVNFLFSENEEEIIDLYRLLNNGIPFDSILAESPEFEEQKTPIEVIYGQMEAVIEDSLYSLKIGRHTAPILTQDGWYIFRLVDKVESALVTQQDIDDANKTVKKLIEARKTNQIYKEFYRRFFSGKKVDINLQLLASLSEKISMRFLAKKNILNLKDSSLIALDVSEMLQIESEFGADTLANTFVYFDNNPVNLKEFIRQLIFDGFRSQVYDRKSIHALLGGRAKTFIEQELLAREGYKQNLNFLPEVQAQVKTWRENYLYQVLQNQFIDSAKVSKDEVYQVYLQRNKPEYYPMAVNIIEVLTDSLEIVEKVLAELEKGRDIRELSKQFTKREWTKSKNGEFGLFPITMHGEIGRIAATLEIGDVYGPLKVPEGYSVFKLIEKRKEKTIPPQPFEKVKSEIERNLRVKKIRAKLNEFTTQLAIKYGLNINYESLNSLEVTNINSFGFRTLGFGGRTTAVPMISPNVEWVESWLNNLKVIP